MRAQDSCADHLLSTAVAPVLIVGPTNNGQAGPHSLNQVNPYDAVLVPLDGSYLGSLALPPAATFAQEADCKLVLLHVLHEHISTPALTAPGFDPARESYVRHAQMEAYLEDLKRSLGSFGVPVETRVDKGEPAGTILRVARSLQRVMLTLTNAGMSAAQKGHKPYEEGSVYSEVIAGWTGPLMMIEA